MWSCGARTAVRRCTRMTSMLCRIRGLLPLLGPLPALRILPALGLLPALPLNTGAQHTEFSAQ